MLVPLVKMFGHSDHCTLFLCVGVVFTVEFGFSREVLAVVLTDASYVHLSSVAAVEGNGNAATNVHCKATNQPSGMPKFLHLQVNSL